jgi:hypothetical protein
VPSDDEEAVVGVTNVVSPDMLTTRLFSIMKD